MARVRARVAWAGFPAWYWLGTAAGLSVLPLLTFLPDWLGLVFCAVVAVLLAVIFVAGSRARGVCEFRTRSAMRLPEVLVLYGPAVTVWLAGSFGVKFVWWSPVVAAVLGFVLFAGTAFTMSARAARR